MLLDFFFFLNAGKNEGMKAAGRDIEAKKQQELKRKRPQERSLFKGEHVTSGTRPGSGTQGKDSRTGRTPTFPAARESLWVFRAHLKDTRTLNSLVFNLFSAEE